MPGFKVHFRHGRMLFMIIAICCLATVMYLKATPFVKNPKFVDSLTKLAYTFNRSFSPSEPPQINEDLFVKPKWERKYFIYDCSDGLCGGLGDRQEGIVAAYIISQILGRIFRVRMVIPCDIANHLQANKQDWIFKPSEVVGLKFQNYKRLDGNAWKLRDRIAKGLNFENEFPSDVTYFNVNQEQVNYLMKHPRYKNLKWAQNKTTADIYNIVLRRLFKLRPNVQKRFNVFQTKARQQGRQLICAQVRLHGNPTLPLDDYVSFTGYPINVTVVWNFLKQYNNSDLYRIFVASDSNQVRQDSKRLFPGVLQDIEGNIVHVDRDNHTKEYGCDGFEKVILDQQTMATCDVFLMTDSGLGRIASMLRGTDDGLYCLANKNTDFKKCSFTDKGFYPSYW